MFATLVAVGLCGVVERDAAMSVVVIPEVDRICVHDPLLVKVVATNNSKRALPFDPPLSTWKWNLSLEVRYPKQRDFLPAKMPRDSCSPPRVAPMGGFEAGAAHVSYNYFFREQHGSGISSVFPEEGDWQIRAKVVVGTRVHVSKPVTIRVGRTPSVEAVLARDACANALMGHTEYLGLTYTRPELDALTKHSSDLKGTNAGATIRRAAIVGDVHFAKTLKERDEAVARLEEYRKTCTPVQQQLLDIQLACVYLERKEYTEARRVAKEIHPLSAYAASINRAINQPDPPQK